MIGLIQSCFDSESGHFKTDNNFVLIIDSVSPNGQFKFYEYQFDNGGYGYSRLFWAVTNNTDEDINLKDFNLPDGYRIIGWTHQNELKIEKWEPYYKKDKEVELTNGFSFKNVKLKIE